MSRELQDTLTELVELSLRSKQLHWTMNGEGFLPTHRYYDELFQFFTNYADDVAERIVALDGVPNGIDIDADDSPFTPLPIDIVSVTESVDTMVEDCIILVESLRERIAHIEDVGSEDLLIEILRGIEKHLWFLRASTDY